MKYLVTLLLIVLFGTLNAAENKQAWMNDLHSKDEVARHRAFRKLVETDFDQALAYSLKSTDMVVHRWMIYQLSISEHPEKLKSFLTCKRQLEQERILDCLTNVKNEPLKTEILEALSQNSSYQQVKNRAKQMLSPFEFYLDRKRLSQREDWDHEVVLINRITLPGTMWKFTTDPEKNLHREKVYLPQYDDSSWKTVKLGPWEEQGFANYDGIGWYRIRFKAPAKPRCNAVELTFNGVDEEAWVWVNGQYIGQHTEGVAGWDKPFTLDMTPEIKWGEENILCVRVYDFAKAGGIWKSITLDILQ